MIRIIAASVVGVALSACGQSSSSTAPTQTPIVVVVTATTVATRPPPTPTYIPLAPDVYEALGRDIWFGYLATFDQWRALYFDEADVPISNEEVTDAGLQQRASSLADDVQASRLELEKLVPPPSQRDTHDLMVLAIGEAEVMMRDLLRLRPGMTVEEMSRIADDAFKHLEVATLAMERWFEEQEISP